MSLVTPLNRVLGLGTAKGAGEHWWRQRLTAVALVPRIRLLREYSRPFAPED